MSIISSRPRVQKINGPVLTTVAAGGAVLAATALKALIGSLSAAHTRVKPTTTPVEEGLQSITDLRDQFVRNTRSSFEQIKGHMPAVEALRAATVAGLAATPFQVDHAQALKPHCQALQDATTVADVKRAEGRLLDALANQHQQIFTNTLAVACARAATRVGFDHIDVVRLPNEIRVIASDAGGRAIVSEIRGEPRQEPSLASEVVGVLDGSCQKILQEFDDALEQEGVRSAPPDRKFTGGVCELASAREIASNRWKPLTRPRPAEDSKRSAFVSRARRLNAVPGTNIHTKG